MMTVLSGGQQALGCFQLSGCCKSSLSIQEAAKRQERREQEAAARQASVSVFLCRIVTALIRFTVDEKNLPFLWHSIQCCVNL